MSATRGTLASSASETTALAGASKQNEHISSAVQAADYAWYASGIATLVVFVGMLVALFYYFGWGNTVTVEPADLQKLLVLFVFSIVIFIVSLIAFLLCWRASNRVHKLKLHM